MLVFEKLRRTVLEPPFEGGAVLVFLALVVCFALDPVSAFWHFRLHDPDDYMRLNQVANWLAGQGWFDLSQPRLSPGDSTVLYWSRLVDLPLAGIAALLSFALPLRQAFMGAALIVPLLLLGLGIVPLAARFARPLVPRERARLGAAMLLFAPFVLFQFMPGRVDHHGYQLIVAGVGIACLMRMAMCPRATAIAIVAALNFALGLWTGGEGLLNLALFAAALALATAWQGGRLLRTAAFFGGALTMFSALLLPVARRFEDWGRFEITWFSGAYVFFAALVGFVFVAGWGVLRFTEKRWLRFALYPALAFFAATLFFTFVPGALSGPYADMAAANVPIILGHVAEARPLFPTRDALLILWTMAAPFVGLCIIAWNLFISRGRRRLLWAMLGVLLLCPTLLALFWQKRVIMFAGLFSIVPLAWLLGRARVLGVLLILIALFNAPLLFTRAKAEVPCALDRVSLDFGRPRLIMNMMNDGPEIMFRSVNSVISAPYDAAGNKDAVDFFSSRDEKRARSILMRRGAEMVLFCRRISPFYAGLDRAALFRSPLVQDGAGNLRVKSDPARLTMIERLLNHAPPVWLKPVEIAQDSGYLLYETSFSKDQPVHDP